MSKTMYLADRTVRLQLWDTAGQPASHPAMLALVSSAPSDRDSPKTNRPVSILMLGGAVFSSMVLRPGAIPNINPQLHPRLERRRGGLRYHQPVQCGVAVAVVVVVVESAVPDTCRHNE